MLFSPLGCKSITKYPFKSYVFGVKLNWERLENEVKKMVITADEMW